MKTFASCLPSPVQLFGCVVVTWFSISEYRHVSLIRFVRLFAPSLQWVPWPPQCPWPCGSPSSPVLWAHKIPPNPSSAISGFPRPQITSTHPRRLRGFPKFLENPCESVPQARNSGGFGPPRFNGGPNSAFDRLQKSRHPQGIDFGAESSRPTSSLSTLLSRRSPGERQDSLPACPLRL